MLLSFETDFQDTKCFIDSSETCGLTVKFVCHCTGFNYTATTFRHRCEQTASFSKTGNSK